MLTQRLLCTPPGAGLCICDVCASLSRSDFELSDGINAKCLGLMCREPLLQRRCPSRRALGGASRNAPARRRRCPVPGWIRWAACRAALPPGQPSRLPSGCPHCIRALAQAALRTPLQRALCSTLLCLLPASQHRGECPCPTMLVIMTPARLCAASLAGQLCIGRESIGPSMDHSTIVAREEHHFVVIRSLLNQDHCVC